MAQGVLPFKYEEGKRDTGMTVLAGLPVYLDLASVMGINESIEKHLHIKQQGWTYRQTLLSLGKIPQHTPFKEPQENLRNAHAKTERRNPLHFVAKLS